MTKLNIKIKSDQQFDSTLKTYVTQRDNGLRNLEDLAIYAIHKFEAHGDLGNAQRLFDSMKKGYENRNGFAKWMMAYSPALFTKGKFSKDKSEAAMPFELAEAIANPFHQKFPMPEPDPMFAVEDIKKRLEQIVKNFSKDKMKPKDEQATNLLKKVDQFVTTI